MDLQKHSRPGIARGAAWRASGPLRVVSSILFCAGFTALPALALAGCASTPDPGPQSAADGGPTSEEETGATEETEASAANDRFCELEATVTVRVDNKSSMNIQLTFGPFRMARPALGFSRTSYQVPRAYLHDPIQLRILSGGLEVGVPPPVATEPVFCNIATLVIGSRPSYAFFYGDALRGDDDWPDVRRHQGRDAKPEPEPESEPDADSDTETDQEGLAPVP